MSTLFAFRSSQALKGAIDLDLFSAIAEGHDTVEALALRLQASARGTRILCDFLTVEGFLTKAEGHYHLADDSAAFLDRKSPMYLGGMTSFLLHPAHLESFSNVAGCVRKGGTMDEGGHLEPENPLWVDFAHGMAALMSIPGRLLAETVAARQPKVRRVLDIAAGHGMFGISVALRNPKAEVTAVDWKNVLTVARENAAKAGVAGRWRALEGSAFEVDLGTGYDVALVTNFLHHFDPETNEKLLTRLYDVLAPGGLVAVLEFVPNDDRVSPPMAAQFALTMLANTPKGDAYTFTELELMLENAGYSEIMLKELVPNMSRVVTGRRQ